MKFQKQENGEVSCDCLTVVAFLEFGGVSTYVSFKRKAEGVVFLFAFSDSFAAPPKKEVVHCSLFSAPSGSLPTLAGTFSELVVRDCRDSLVRSSIEENVVFACRSRCVLGCKEGIQAVEA